MNTIGYLRAPIFIWWDVTYACNLKCKQCYSSAGKPAVNELTTLEAKVLIKELAEMKVFYIYFLGGEPLLRKDIFELAEYARDCGVETMTSTNGWFLTPSVATRLKKAGFMHIRVSLDGATAETHDAIRGVKGSFDKAINAIKALREVGIPRVGISPTVLSENVEEMSALIELAVSLGVDEMQLVQLCRTGRGHAAQPLNMDQLREVRLVFEEYRAKLRGILNLTATEGIDTDYIDPHSNSAFPDFWGCVAGRTCVSVEAEGTVQPCILYGVPAGNLRHASFRDIWHKSPILENLRKESKDCGGCTYASECAGPCPVERNWDSSYKKQFVEKSYTERR